MPEIMDAKRNAVLKRIEVLQEAIRKAKEYLESGKHANWKRFRPLFDRRLRDGKELPPHKDWVKNVFLPRREKALSRAETILDRLSQDKKSVRSSARRQERRQAAG
jgi:hypothetical protein